VGGGWQLLGEGAQPVEKIGGRVQLVQQPDGAFEQLPTRHLAGNHVGVQRGIGQQQRFQAVFVRQTPLEGRAVERVQHRQQDHRGAGSLEEIELVGEGLQGVGIEAGNHAGLDHNPATLDAVDVGCCAEPCAEISCIGRAVGRRRRGGATAEDVARQRWLAPVARGDAWARYPDFPGLARLARHTRRRVDNEQMLVVDVLPAADDRAVVLEAHHSGRIASAAARHHERRLGQSVARVKGVVSKAIWSEGVGEPSDSGCVHRLRAIERHLPARQVQPCPLGGWNAIDAQVECEVRAAADGSAGPRDGLQPAARTLQKGDGRHAPDREAGVDAYQDPAHQAHVVVGRQPDHSAAASSTRHVEAPLDLGRVVQQIGVRHHDAARRGRRPGRVLQHRHVAG